MWRKLPIFRPLNTLPASFIFVYSFFSSAKDPNSKLVFQWRKVTNNPKRHFVSVFLGVKIKSTNPIWPPPPRPHLSSQQTILSWATSKQGGAVGTYWTISSPQAANFFKPRAVPRLIFHPLTCTGQKWTKKNSVSNLKANFFFKNIYCTGCAGMNK